MVTGMEVGLRTKSFERRGNYSYSSKVNGFCEGVHVEVIIGLVDEAMEVRQMGTIVEIDMSIAHKSRKWKESWMLNQ